MIGGRGVLSNDVGRGGLDEWGIDANAHDVISEAGLVLLGDHDDLVGLAMEVGVILELCNPSEKVMIAVAVFQLPVEVELWSTRIRGLEVAAAMAMAMAEVEKLDSVHVMAVNSVPNSNEFLKILNYVFIINHFRPF